MQEVIIPLWAIWTLFGIAIASKILNSATKHFSEYKGFVKWALFLVDVLDIFKTTPLPNQPKKDKIDIKVITTFFVAGVMLGCGTLGVIAGAACTYIPIAQAVHGAICNSLSDTAKEKCNYSKKIADKAAAIASELPVKVVKVCK